MMLKLNLVGPLQLGGDPEKPKGVLFQVDEGDPEAVKALREFIRAFHGKDVFLVPLDAVTPYALGSDLVGDFLEECCLLVPDHNVSAYEFYFSFRNWCIKYKGLAPKNVWSMYAVAHKMQKRPDIKRIHSDGKCLYAGIELKEDFRFPEASS